MDVMLAPTDKLKRHRDQGRLRLVLPQTSNWMRSLLSSFAKFLSQSTNTRENTRLVRSRYFAVQESKIHIRISARVFIQFMGEWVEDLKSNFGDYMQSHQRQVTGEIHKGIDEATGAYIRVNTSLTLNRIDIPLFLYHYHDLFLVECIAMFVVELSNR